MLVMNSKEIAISFLSGEHTLYGIVHQPAQLRERGVLIVTGRPALRAGRHRLFVLLARAWAEAGIPVMRFDFRGTGDCEGEIAALEETAADIRSAVDAFLSHVPGLQQVVLWGLCGGAADSILYAPNDSRVAGIVLANPWLYDPHIRRLAKWRHTISLGFSKVINWIRSAHQSGAVPAPVAFEQLRVEQVKVATPAVQRAYASYRAPDLSKRLAAKLAQFKGRVLFIFSGKDDVSRAFKRIASISPRWRRVFSSARVQTRVLPEANHSLRRPEWRAKAADWTLEWLRTF
jgi:exosortase A-associated hydrolase 1